jgi:hypothetical protein
MSLITYDQAVAHLRVSIPHDSPTNPAETDLRLKMLQAEEIVLTRIKQQGSSPTWDSTTVPPQIQAAILMQLGELWRFRGDDTDGAVPKREVGRLAPSIENVLIPHVDPTLA